MVKIFENEQLVAEAIANEMLRHLEAEFPVFCLASGSTPSKGYDLFAKAVASKIVSLKRLKFVSLDEWVGIDKDNIGSCYQMLNEDLFQKLDLESDQVIFYDGVATDVSLECQRIDGFVNECGITFSLMGVGMNGHIGLNEPGFPKEFGSSVVKLSDTTKEVAQKYFKEKTVLEEGITLGLGQIINSKRVIVVVTGAHKAQIVKEIFEKKSADIPASQLLGYDHIDFYLDAEAVKYALDEGLIYDL